jgi:hypothetical protein
LIAVSLRIWVVSRRTPMTAANVDDERDARVSAVEPVPAGG